MDSKPAAACLMCVNNQGGRPFHVAFKNGIKYVRVRCTQCRREWTLTEPPAKSSEGKSSDY
jgi:hypothetical protein